MSENNNIGEIENYLFGKDKKVSFIAPPHYFDSLSARIINKIEAMEEMSEFSVLSSINKQTDFIVPENYFERRENNIEYKAELEEYAALSAIEKKNNFEVEADYFDTVAERVKERIYSKSQPQLSFAEKILLFVLKPKFNLAFGIVVIIGVSSLFYFNRTNTITDSGDCKTLACLEKREMLNEHTVREMDDDNLYEMVDVDKLNEQLKGADAKDSVAVKENKK